MKPKSIIVDIGSKITSLDKNNITLTCPISGMPVPKVTWLKDGEIIQRGGRTLLLSTIGSPEGGEYTCRASNTLGSVTEASSDIDVIGRW